MIEMFILRRIKLSYKEDTDYREERQDWRGLFAPALFVSCFL